VSERRSFTAEEARSVGAQIGIDWQSAPFDEIKYAKLHARLSDPRLQREKIRLPFFLIFSKGNYRTYEC